MPKIHRRSRSNPNRSKLIALTRARQAAGESISRIAADLGVPKATLYQWLRKDRGQLIQPVVVAGAPPSALVIRTAHGLTLEGLDLDMAVAILERLR